MDQQSQISLKIASNLANTNQDNVKQTRKGLEEANRDELSWLHDRLLRLPRQSAALEGTPDKQRHLEVCSLERSAGRTYA